MIRAILEQNAKNIAVADDFNINPLSLPVYING